MKRLLLACLAACLLPGDVAGSELPNSPATAWIELVHADANTGGSSGGHVALKLGDSVYHYQYHPDRLLRMVSESWPDFRYRYGSLGNRSLRLWRVEVTPETYQRVRDRMAQVLVIQGRNLDRLEALRFERRLFETLRDRGAGVRLPGLGLFSPGQRNDPHALELRSAVERTYGRGFLAREIERLGRELSHRGDEVSDPREDSPSTSRFLDPDEITAEWRRERLLLREALRAIRDARPLAPQSLLDMEEFASPEPAGLGPDQRTRLTYFAGELVSAVARLVRSRRPDRGRPLLVAAARYQAIRRSLDAGRLLTLDPFPDDAPVVHFSPGREAELVSELADRFLIRYRAIRGEVLGAEPLTESAYQRLEETAARYYEVALGANRGGGIRTSAPIHLVPSRSGQAPLPPTKASQRDLDRAAALARDNESWYWERLGEMYRYDLLRSNCATELTRALNSAFANPQEAARALGGALEPGGDLGFIPFVLARQFEGRLAVRESVLLPSYRRRRIAEMAERENPLLVRLRESNTVTSTVYSGARGDGAFLLFADDALLQRPLYGAANLGYGLLHAGVGLLTLPLDRGQRTWSGMRGALYSLPELVWINIRKGHFEFVPENPH